MKIILILVLTSCLFLNEAKLAEDKFSLNQILVQLNSTDFRNKSDLKLVDFLVSRFQSNDSVSASQYIDIFCDTGGLELIYNWVGSFNLSRNQNGTIKYYCGKTASLLAIGSAFPQFCEKLVKKAVLERLLPTFMLDSLFFGDIKFTEDLFSAILICLLNCVQINSLRPSIQAVMISGFGPSLISIENRFRAEKPSELKILLASLLAQQRNLTEFPTDRFNLELQSLIDLRDLVIDKLNYLVYRDIFTYKYSMQTAFIVNLTLSTVDLARHLNSLVLGENNRKNLCGGTTLQLYFSKNDFFSKSLQLAVVSLRALQFLCQNCEDYPEQLKDRHIEDRKYEHNQIIY